MAYYQCCFCGKKMEGMGFNPDPILNGGNHDCCSGCDREIVLAVRRKVHDWKNKALVRMIATDVIMNYFGEGMQVNGH